LTEDDRARNRHADRALVKARVAQLCRQQQWSDDEEELGYAFHPETIVPDLREDAAVSATTLTPRQRRVGEFTSEALHQAFVKLGLLTGWQQAIINAITDAAIGGDAAASLVLPEELTGGVVSFPLWGDKIVISLASRFTDIETHTQRLATECRRRFGVGQRTRPAPRGDRNTWLWAQYRELKERRSNTHADSSLYDELLALYADSQWADDLSRYDLGNKEGQKAAKSFLRQAVHRARQWYAKHIPDEPTA